ncbi:MAG: AMP-binding protein [Microbacteriaceae bacterium]
MPSNHDLGVLRYRLRAARAGHPLVITTSGSTEQPKRVALSWQAMHAAAQASAAVIGSGNWLLALPTEYVAGVMVDVRAQSARAKTRVWGEESFVAAAAQLSAPKYVSLVPAQLRDLLDQPAAAEALATFAAVLIGGQRLTPVLRARAEAAGVRAVATYGSTETCGGCVYDGRPVPGVELRVDESGRLFISGPMLAEGYLTDSGELDAVRTAHGFVEFDGRRWLRTDDRAVLHHDADGVRLEVVGRIDDVIISGGLKLDLAEVQRFLDAELGAERAVAVAVDGTRWGQSLGVWCESAAPDDLSARLIEQFGPAAHPVLAAGGIPRLSSGKADRVVLARALRERAADVGLLDTGSAHTLDGDE